MDAVVHRAGDTQPWWLATPRKGDLFSTPVSTISEDQRELNHGAHIYVYTRAGSAVLLSAPVVYHYVDRVRGDVQRPLIVAPGVSINLEQATTMTRANVPVDLLLKTTLRSALGDSTPVTVTLSLPRGLSADSLIRTVVMAPGGTRTLAFKVRGTLPRGNHQIAATATAKGKSFQTGYIPIEYPHITAQRIYRSSTLGVNAVDVRLPSRLNVAYIQA